MVYRDSPDNAVRRAIYSRALGSPLSYQVIGSDCDRRTITSERTAFDNEVFDPPPDNEPWLRLVVRSGTREQINMGRPGNRRFLVTSSVLATVWTLSDIGIKQADELCRQALNWFDTTSALLVAEYRPSIQTYRIRIKFQAAGRREGGDEGRWSRSVVETPFTYEEKESWA